MFGKDKTKEQEIPVITNKPVSKEVKTILAEGCRIDGNLFVITSARIDGTIKGDIKGDNSLIIGSKGKIQGNINIPEVIIYGNVNGNVRADKLELKRGSLINGNLSINNFITEFGALFNGKCSMKEDESYITEQPDNQDFTESPDVKIKRAGKQTADKNDTK